MSETIVQAIVDFLKTQGIEGSITLGRVTFDYLSLAFGALVGFVFGIIVG